MTTALYPGSFDPVTYGHLDIIKRAAALFDRLVIGVYDRPDKRLLFNTAERVALLEEATKNLSNVSVRSYNELTVEFARKIGARVMVRGLRMSSDFEHEFELAMMNRKLAPDIELVCMMASLQYQFLSSSLLKEAASLGGCIDDLVPPHVAKALAAKFKARA
ncbi:MAG: pantetheine-phosphate adenylyltransferase [Dehalococcoidia bacterium]|nr:pantetheine-phosphate adenylyltransferase [Dehalococcoidia bacterium]